MKSRDEILSLTFMALTLYCSFVYVESKNKMHILWACVCYFIALLSKEYGVSLLLLVPMGLYVYYKKMNFSDIIMLMGGLVVTFGIYYSIRSGVVLDIGSSSVQDSELLNNPYLLATEAQASATKVFMNLKYFILLMYPYAMSSDYSYNVIPYQEYTDISVILSILLLIGSSAGFFIALKKRSWLAFPIAFALAHLFLVNNMFFNIGATMGERLVYHTSLGTCMLMVYGAYYFFTRVLKQNGNLAAMIIVPIIVLYSVKTIARNPAWKNDYTLTMTDVNTYPNSIMLNGNACNRLIEMSEFPKNAALEKKFLDSASNYGRKALQLHPGYVTTYMNMGLIKFKLNDVDSAASYWDNVIRLFPTHPNVPQIRQTLRAGYYSRADAMLKAQRADQALVYLLKAYKYTPDDPKLNYDIGNYYMMLQNVAKAREFWTNGLRTSPSDPNLNNALRSIQGR
jgi:cytochrome c-type biogenesis protein CcmH/NrfG